jgi:hypothetical protein
VSFACSRRTQGSAYADSIHQPRRRMRSQFSLLIIERVRDAVLKSRNLSVASTGRLDKAGDSAGAPAAPVVPVVVQMSSPRRRCSKGRRNCRDRVEAIAASQRCALSVGEPNICRCRRCAAMTSARSERQKQHDPCCLPAIHRTWRAEQNPSQHEAAYSACKSGKVVVVTTS